MPEAKEFWRTGKPLVDAPIHFAPRSLIRELKKSDLGSGKEWADIWAMYADGRGDINDKAMQRIADGLNGLQGAFADWSARTSYNLKCRAYLLRSLSQERLLAYGIAKGSKTPSLIPAFLFEYPKYAIWEESRVLGNELEFISVRIVRPTLPAWKAANVRELRSAKLIEIIREFIKDPVFAKLLRKSQANNVRSEIIKRYPKLFPDGRYADIKTISRYLRKYIPAN